MRNIIVAIVGTIIGATLGVTVGIVAFKNKHEYKYEPRQEVLGEITKPTDNKRKLLFSHIVTKYKVDPKLVKDVIKFAYKYEHETFPRAKDILAIVGIESSWNPRAVSNLKKDPAVGLTQIRPGVWKDIVGSRTALMQSIEHQIKSAAYILHWNFKQTKNPDHAIIAYNAGIGAFGRGEFTDNYLNKFKRERQSFNFGG